MPTGSAVPPAASAPPPFVSLPNARANLLAFCGVYLLAWTSLLLSVQTGGRSVYPVLLAEGLALAFLVRYGLRLWPGTVAGLFLGKLIFGFGLPLAVIYTTAAALSALLGAWLLTRRRVAFDLRLTSVRDVLVFSALGGVLPAVTYATIASTPLSAVAGLELSEAGPYLWLHGGGFLMGVLALGPLALRLHPGFLRFPRPRIAVEFAVTLSALVLVSLGVFLVRSDLDSAFSSLAFLPFAAMLWIAFRFLQRGACLAVPLVTAVSSVCTLTGAGPFLSADPLRSVGVLLSYNIILSFILYMLAAANEERHLTGERLLLALNSMGLGLWEWNRGRGLAFYDNVWAEKLGVTPRLYYPRDFWLPLVHPEDQESSVLDPGSYLPEAPEAIRSGEFRMRLRGEADWTWVRSFGHVIEQSGEEGAGRIIGLLQDIAEHKRIEEGQREAMRNESELRVLRTQVNPHFLFNCLNSLRALVIEDSDRAREAITALARFMRSSLNAGQAELVALSSELDTVKNYLDLEAIRYREKLRVRYEVDEESKPLPVPPMLVQTLVENAVKYGIARTPGGGTIEIRASRRKGFLCLKVSNTGRLQPAPIDASKIGLKNSHERIRLLFGTNSSLHLYQAEENLVVAEVFIPLSGNGHSPAGDAARPS